MWRECNAHNIFFHQNTDKNIFSTLASNAIDSIPSGAFSNLQYLKQVELRGNPIHFFHPDAFAGLPSLNKLQMLGSPRGANTFPNLTGSPHLELVHLDRLNLDTVPANLCSLAPRLHTLWVTSLEKFSSILDLDYLFISRWAFELCWKWVWILLNRGSISQQCLLFSGDSEATSWQTFPFWQTVQTWYNCK